jgi:chlorite dismutase
MSRPPFESPKPDVAERGSPVQGQPQSLDQRLFIQLLAFGGCDDALALVHTLRSSGLECVLYQDLNDPRGVALLTFHRDPDHFITRVHPLLRAAPFASLNQKHELTMIGRTYALGHEANLQEWLFDKPRRTALNPATPWAVWYPLRRKGEFMRLTDEERAKILMEHARIGMGFVSHDLGHDIRLACHGLDRDDSDFVIGLIGAKLDYLSKMVEAMRRTIQTSQYIERLGPFFVGRVIHQSAP